MKAGYTKMLRRGRTLLSMRRTTRNWHSIAALSLGLQRQANPRFRDGTELTGITRATFPKYASKNLERRNGIARGSDGMLSFAFNGRKVRLLDENIATVCEVFFSDMYANLCCEGEDVVDVGAFVGDSAIRFALLGARHVYAYEPFPRPFRQAVENVRINGLAKKVTVRNEGVAGRDGKIIIDNTASEGAVARKARKGTAVRFVRLKTMLSDLGLERIVLKVDCEGGEYPFLLSAPDSALRKVACMVVEYHYGYKDLAERLGRAGFKVRLQAAPEFIPRAGPMEQDMALGILYAYRR